MLSKFYELLWRRVGGRPWTYILRDWVKKGPLEALIIAMAIGVIAGRFVPGLWMLIAAAVFLFGLLLGHLFWDTKGAYIKKLKAFRR